MNNKSTSEPHQATAAAAEAGNLVRSRSAGPAELLQQGNSNTQAPLPSVLAQRLVKMGLAPCAPPFPPDGVPLAQLVPYWRLWGRDPQHNYLVHPGAAMFPVIAEGIASLQQGHSAPQAVFAALLPIHQKETAVAQWTKYTIAAGCDPSFGGPAAPAAVLEFLLEGRSDGDRFETWRQVMEAFFDCGGQFRFPDSTHAVALIECIGRSGLRPLGPLVCRILQSDDREIVMTVVACLARLGVPDGEISAESLLTRFRAETVEHGWRALDFVESCDIDRLDGLLGTAGWLERVQALRLAEAVLSCGPMVERLGEEWLHRLAGLLLARLQADQDRDVVRCLATTLGLALGRCSNPPLEQVIQVAGQLTDEGRFESLLNALLIAGLPNSAAIRIEGLRGQSLALGHDAARALNRVMMALGEPCGCIFDWLTSEIAALRHTGVLRLPVAVQDWFDFPERCPEAQVASWLRDPGDADLASMFCAAYLIRRPTFLKVLEQLWVEAAFNSETDLLKLTGGLLAGAADDCGASPAELRCCLGHKIGGPLPESPENAGRLIGMVLTQEGDVRESAEALLLQMTREYRIVAAAAVRWLPRNRNPFGKEGAPLRRLGVPALALDHAGLLPFPLQPLFSTGWARGCPPRVLLDTMVFGGGRKGEWAKKSLEWSDPEVVRTAFLETDSAELAAAFLRVSSSIHSDLRRNALRLATGVGARLLQTSFRDRIIQRLVDLAQDSDKETRAEVVSAAQSLGVADRVPVQPSSAFPSDENGNAPETVEPPNDPALQELLAEIDRSF